MLKKLLNSEQLDFEQIHNFIKYQMTAPYFFKIDPLQAVSEPDAERVPELDEQLHRQAERVLPGAEDEEEEKEEQEE